MRLGTNNLFLYSNGQRYKVVLSGHGKTLKYATYVIDTGVTKTINYETGVDILDNAHVYIPDKDGWTFIGWREDTTVVTDSADTLSSKIMGTENIKLYAVWTRTLALYYNGNGSTSGSTSTQIGSQYFNAGGNYINPSFTLASNGFTRTNYTFSKWALGSTSGTQYSVGSTVTISGNTTMYAVWVGNSWTFTSYSSYPLTLSFTQDAASYSGTNNGSYVVTCKEATDGVSNGFGMVTYKVTIPTNGLTKVRIKAKNKIHEEGGYYAHIAVNGVEQNLPDDNTDAYYYFNCSSSSSMTLEIGANCGGDTWNTAITTISEIYFYNE